VSAVAAEIEAPAVDIRQVMTDTALFGDQFGGDSWAAWRALLSGFYGLNLDGDERRYWHALTGRSQAAESAHDELWLAVGRRGGKSQCAALLAVFEAMFKDYSPKLSPGEVATVMVLAADRKQARSVMRYIGGLIRSNPMLERMVLREDRESIELINRCTIEVHTASFRAVRGYSVACVICDEVAFWRSEDSANPDYEILAAVRPAMATLGGRLIALSSPYAKRGELWQAYKRYFGRNDAEVLVAKAPSMTMNPTLPQKVVDRAMARDEAAARSEYLAEFRSDLASFVSREIVDACVIPGRFELPHAYKFQYSAFVDPSGGSNDSMTLCIGHVEGQTVVIDCTREVKPPFSPEAVVKDFCDTLADYRIRKVEGDKYAGEWPRERFSVHKIEYDASAKPRTDLYRDTLPLMNAGLIELPDNERLVNQLCSLERRTSRGGKDSIDHSPGAHDDLANAVAGLASMLSTRRTSTYTLKNL